MRPARSRFSFPLLAALVALALAAALPAQTIVRVLHQNIHREIGNDVVFEPPSTAQLALAKIVNHLAPDVWTMNELAVSNGSGVDFAAAHEALAAFVGAHVTIFGPNPQVNVHYFIYLGQRTDGFITSAIVSRHPFLATQTYSDAWPAEGVAALRGLVSARVDLPGPVEMGVFTAHLKASSFSDSLATSTLNATKRRGQATANAVNLAAWLAAHPGDGAVMTGDFNETEEPGDTDNWKAGAIGDPIPDTGMIYHPVTTIREAGFADPRPASILGNLDTLDATSPDVRFDYLLYRASHFTRLSGTLFDTKQIDNAGQLAAYNAANVTTFIRADSATASDHLPVFEVFLVKASAAAFSSIVKTGPGLAILWPSALGSSYRVESRASLPTGTWAVLQSGLAGTGETLGFLEPAAIFTQPQRFYRIVPLP